MRELTALLIARQILAYLSRMQICYVIDQRAVGHHLIDDVTFEASARNGGELANHITVSLKLDSDWVIPFTMP